MIARLPPRRKPMRSGISRAPKRVWLRHRKFLRGFCCCVPGCLRCPVDRGSGTALKPFDWFTVPLCRGHHEEEEAAGPDAFGDRYGIDLWAMAAALVAQSPDRAMREALSVQP